MFDNFDPIEMILRASAAFLVLLLLTRVMGKKQLSQLTFFHYVTGITIGSIAADIGGESETPFFNGLVSLVWWALLTILLNYLGLKSTKVRSLLDGHPIMIIKDGKILEEALKRSRLNIDDLNMLLREKNVFSIQDVETAVFEPHGKVSIILKAEKQPFTKKDGNIKTTPPKYMPMELMVGGEVIKRNLEDCGLTEKWLNKQLETMHLEKDKVFYVELQEDGSLYIDKYEDGAGGQASG